MEKMSADVDELARRGKPLAIAPGGSPLIQNPRGNQGDDHANDRHVSLVPIVDIGIGACAGSSATDAATRTAAMTVVFMLDKLRSVRLD